MGFINKTDAYAYYTSSQKFTGDGVEVDFTLSFYPILSSASSFVVYINGSEVDDDLYSYNGTTGVITFDTAPEENSEIAVALLKTNLGNYRYVSLADIVRNFMVSYVGDGKIISKARRSDVVFHTKRAIQEFSYDISRVEKIQEVQLGSTLTIPMPQDYVNYVAVSWVDGGGVEHPIPYGRISHRPSEAVLQDDENNYLFDENSVGIPQSILTGTSVTQTRFTSANSTEVQEIITNTDYFASEAYPSDFTTETNKRYGGEPELMNINGMFTIDEAAGTFAFSSNLVNSIILIKYISDGLGTDDEMRVNKMAEEAIYKYVACAVLESMANIPEYIINRFKKERRASMRNAKLRLYNIKMSEMTNVMRGKSKQIKH